jgi:hypothetical protein
VPAVSREHGARYTSLFASLWRLWPFLPASSRRLVLARRCPVAISVRLAPVDCTVAALCRCYRWSRNYPDCMDSVARSPPRVIRSRPSSDAVDGSRRLCDVTSFSGWPRRFLAKQIWLPRPRFAKTVLAAGLVRLIVCPVLASPGGNASVCDSPIATPVPCVTKALSDGSFVAAHRIRTGVAAHVVSDSTRACRRRERRTDGSTVTCHALSLGTSPL